VRRETVAMWTLLRLRLTSHLLGGMWVLPDPSLSTQLVRGVFGERKLSMWVLLGLHLSSHFYGTILGEKRGKKYVCHFETSFIISFVKRCFR